MLSAIKYTRSWFLIQNGKKFLLFKDFQSDFYEVVDNNECRENAGYSPNAFCLTCMLHSTGHTIYVSVIKNRGVGFACSEVEVCGYSYGDTVSICKQRWYEGRFGLHAEHVDVVEVPACDSPQYKSIQILICCKILISSVRAALADWYA